jgi:hypothetical protein
MLQMTSHPSGQVFEAIQLFRIMSIPTTFRLFRVLTSDKLGKTTSGVYAITVTTSAYHSRRCGRL